MQGKEEEEEEDNQGKLPKNEGLHIKLKHNEFRSLRLGIFPVNPFASQYNIHSQIPSIES